MKDFIIYKIADNYQGEECELSIGTLPEVHSAYKQWLEEHWDGYRIASEQEKKVFAKHYPKAQLFYDNPEEWINKYGDSGTEIYFGWELTHVYSSKSIVVDVGGYHPEDDETRYVYDFEEMANDFENQLNRLMQRTTDKI